MTPVYTLTIFTSAFLLFLIQPMISKLLLPHLGGSPALWNTAMMFFQMLLLGGYAYAHFGVAWLGAKRQAWLHLVLLVVALFWLPVAAKTELGFSSAQYPLSWVVWSLLLSVGMPFFVLAANAPLLQCWMAQTNHKDAKNPYFLYSASNAGSLLALCGYPFVMEPLLTLSQQTALWSALFVAFIGGIVACVLALRGRYRPAAQAAEESAQAPTRQQKMRWVALAFFPSSLLLGVTTYITMDIASMPLFWVIPLALYLITFIFAFAQTPIGVDWAIKSQVLLVPLTALAIISKINHASLILLLHLLTFFVLALGCHGTLARSKPHPKYLTAFYLWISVGGMLGGVFNALIAPQIFTGLVEYPLVLGLALLARPLEGVFARPAREKKLDMLVPGVALAASVLFVIGSYTLARGQADIFKNEWLLQLLAVVLCVGITMLAATLARRPLRFSLTFLALVLVLPLANTETTQMYAERNFFGVNRVFHRPSDNAILLMHGTTVHGIQGADESLRLEVVSYYGPLREVFAALAPTRRDDPVAVIGLGAGTLACLGHAQQVFDFYEIDPAVVAIASNPKLFTYLKDCPPKTRITLGDGRLEVAKARDGHYGILVVDAFSSDAIPMHLLTREALAAYENKIGEEGLLAFNISNRHLDLVPLMAALAEDAGFAARVKKDAEPEGPLSTSSVWVVMAREEAGLSGLREERGWERLTPSGAQIWTDNYSNILQTLF